MIEKVILVDEKDVQRGTMEKMQAHQLGELHRAFSILVSNLNNDLLIQQRAFGKYHCPGLWSNTCCGHPRPKEETKNAVVRRLQEEMGFECSHLEHLYTFQYKYKFSNGLTENEIDHVYIGAYEGPVYKNIEEVTDFKWMPIEAIRKDKEKNPEKYTPWFKMIIDTLKDKYRV